MDDIIAAGVLLERMAVRWDMLAALILSMAVASSPPAPLLVVSAYEDLQIPMERTCKLHNGVVAVTVLIAHALSPPPAALRRSSGAHPNPASPLHMPRLPLCTILDTSLKHDNTMNMRNSPLTGFESR